MEDQVLVVESDPQRAKALCHLLGEQVGYKSLHVPTVVAALREHQSRPFVLIMTNITLQREMDGIKLLQHLLADRPVQAWPVVVVTSEGDPAVIKQCLQAGVADYLLYPCEPETLVQRVRKAVEQFQDLGEKLVRIATLYLGPAARRFLEQQTRLHLNNLRLAELRADHLPDLFHWIQISVAPILRGKSAMFLHRLERTFEVKRRP